MKIVSMLVVILCPMLAHAHEGHLAMGSVMHAAEHGILGLCAVVVFGVALLILSSGRKHRSESDITS